MPAVCSSTSEVHLPVVLPKNNAKQTVHNSLLRELDQKGQPRLQLSMGLR
jgi:hypothetical protein